MNNFISMVFGIVAGIKFPRFIQNMINSGYISAFKIDMSEFESEFESLNALFTRKLKKARALEEGFISPSDGVIFESGVSNDLMGLCVKNHEYKIDEMLSSLIDEGQKKEELSYANIYLSPKDYHHYHAPCDLEILSSEYIPAKLYSVAKKYLIKIPNLYALNERVILKCKMANGGILWMVFVGALNVGKMRFDFDEEIKTNAKAGEIRVKNYENLRVKKGEHLGNFELGSTIVLVSQAKFLRFDLKRDLSVKFGMRIA